MAQARRDQEIDRQRRRKTDDEYKEIATDIDRQKTDGDIKETVRDSQRQSDTVTDSHRQSQTVTDRYALIIRLSGEGREFWNLCASNAKF